MIFYLLLSYGILFISCLSSLLSPPPSLPPYLLSSLPPQASISENLQANAAERLQEAKMRGEINVLGGPLEVRISLCAL